MAYQHWSYDTLHRLCMEAFQKFGFTEAEADIIQDVLLTADLYGIESHGMQRMVRYHKCIEKGMIDVHAKPEVVFETPISAVIDAHEAMGQLVSHRAMEMAIEKAKATGVGIVSVRNSNHYGIAGYYAKMACKEGLMGFSCTNSEAIMAGKTTLTSLMARFWDVDSGTVKLGGTDIREYQLDSLMANFSMVFQTVYLFNDTIENNIKFGKPGATHEEVVAVAKAARCHDFISALPDGYDTVIGEGGATISGGERQRLSIARAMLKDSPIIILDEATANVDPENEAELQEAIEALTHNKTIIMIAHRLKTVQHADQILVLEAGRIIQRGRHEDLIKQDGIYADFVQSRKKAESWSIAGEGALGVGV